MSSEAPRPFPGPAPAAPPWSLEVAPGSLDGRIDFRRLFGADRPVEVEVGSGKGRFLIEQAEARRDTSFLGVEWSLKYLRVTRDRSLKRGLSNLRLLRADARHVVPDLIPDGSLRRVHVYCPDPWPKKRHHKRRFLTAATVPHLERILEAGGFLHVSTDVVDYFEAIVTVLRDHTGLVTATDPLFPSDALGGKTSYEVKYLKAGRTIHRACWSRVTRSPR